MMLLKTETIEVCYGIIPAVRDLSLEVREGQIVALIGANGAGKSTTLKALAGVLRPRQGKIFYREKEITSLSADRRVPLGITLVPEGRQLFSTLTTKENLRLGAYCYTETEFKEGLDWIYSIFPILKERENQIAGTLSGGEQQMLAFGRAIISKPQLLLLDEPSLGLAPLIIKEVYEVIEKIKSTGITIILVEQNIKMAMRVTDYMYLMEAGEITIQGEPLKVMKDEDIRKAYLG
ncbi:MAG: ABC transporter ATP-binding protein [Candidatus Atribacteria bacterium]|nr:ABC transporter ATP-binding protein [Candidatus Atribacteria bacterium]MCK4309061.1 ABC transporter ATP-binding protein [Candidatus Atribacteria bacterium]